MKKNVKKILVTGGAGFIGYHLCNALCKSNKNHVIAIDNFFSGQIKNVLDLKINSNFEFFKRDVCKTLNFEIDEIYHLACPASPYVYQSKPLKTIRLN